MWAMPSRGRPENLERFLEAFRETQAKATLFLRLDADDETLEDYLALDIPRGWFVEVGPRVGAAASADEMFRKFPTESVYGFVSDDVVPGTPGWDGILEAAAMPDRVAFGRSPERGAAFADHPVIGGHLVRQVGFLNYGFAHYGMDNFWTHLARALGKLVYCEDVLMEHRQAPSEYPSREEDRRIWSDLRFGEEWPKLVERLRA